MLIRLFLTQPLDCIFILLLLIIGTSIVSCNSNPRALEIESALESAGSNRPELELVLTHYRKYPKDSLKLRAAEFLIRNMPGHFAYSGPLLSKYDHIFDRIADLERDHPLVGSIHYPSINRAWDSISALYGQLDVKKLDRLADSQSITANLLIENIEQAFIAWNYPWSKHLSFVEFCQFILPYRFDNERLESWRPVFRKKYEWLIDSMKGSTDPIVACRFINNDIKKWLRFNELFNKYPCAIAPSGLLKGKMGKCIDQAAIATYAMRAMGVPISHEVIPQWADRNMGHDFSSVLAKNGKFVDFLGGELPPGKNEIRNVAPKIYRVMFSKSNDYENDISESNIMLNSIADKFLLDVTSDYIATRDVYLRLPQRDNSGRQFLLAVFDNQNWVPIACAIADGNHVKFKNVGCGALYLPMETRNGSFVPVAQPFTISKHGAIKKIEYNKRELETVELKRKYPLNGIKIWWLTLMGGGVFEGANDYSFRNSSKLFVIPDTIEMKLNRAPVTHPGAFRFVRYRFPDNKSGSLGELAFYGSENVNEPLKGKPIKSKKVSEIDLEIAFDNKLDVFIDRTPNSEYNGEWVGLDLGNSRKISSVGFSPRNDRNGILSGMEYELLYWDNEWKTITKLRSDSNLPLRISKVPVNALLWLRNHTEGKEERVFIFKGDQQIWW